MSRDALLYRDVWFPELRAWSPEEHEVKHLRPTFEAIERYQFQNTAIAASSSSRGISAMYARYARELTDVSSEAQAIALLHQLRNALADRIPDPLVFDHGFKELEYSDSCTRDKKLVQYACRRLHNSERSHRPGKPTLEHLVPQNAASEHSPIGVIGNIGNLLWVDEELNTKLAHKPFAQKKAILSEYRELYDIDDILSTDTWESRKSLSVSNGLRN